MAYTFPTTFYNMISVSIDVSGARTFLPRQCQDILAPSCNDFLTLGNNFNRVHQSFMAMLFFRVWVLFVMFFLCADFEFTIHLTPIQIRMIANLKGKSGMGPLT